MDVASNDGSIGKYKDFGDRELKSFVAEQPYLRALDVRDSHVTSDGLIHLGTVEQINGPDLFFDELRQRGLTLTHPF